MKSLKFFFVALAAISMVACHKEPADQPAAKAEDMTFEASITAVTGGPAVTFAKNDAITVFDSKSGNNFTTAAGGATASFAGKAIKSDSYSAVYPALENTARYSGKASIVIPSVQTPVEGGVPAGAVAVAVTKDNKLAFKYATGLLKITVPAEEKIVSVEVVAKGGEALAGEAKLGLDANAAIEIATAAPKLSISANALAGTYYLVAAPATLSQGLEITAVDENSRRATVAKTGNVEAGKTLDLGTLSNLEWSEDVENPNPTAVPAYLYKASFNKADFNLISDGGFENINPDNVSANTVWQFPGDAVRQVVEGHTGNQALKVENPTPRVWFDVAVQTTALHSGVTYKYSAYIQRTTPHMYNGVRTFPDGPLQEIKGPDTYVEGAGWTLYEHEFVQGNGQQWGDVFIGLWGDAGAYAMVDDVKLVPKDYEYSSIEPATVAAVETFNNKTFSEITSAAKVIVFKGLNDKYVVAFSGLTIDGVTYDNGVALAESADIANGLSIKTLVKSGVTPVPFLELGENEIAIVPNSGFVKDGKLYIHYYAKVGQNPDNADDWTISRAGFVMSEDGGQTWTKCAGEWGPESNFASASIFEKDGKIYMAGSYRGRDLGLFAGFRFARIDASADFTDPTKWEYLNRVTWVASEADVPNLSVSMMGARGEGQLIYNAKWERWMLIYRGHVNGIVYRDAAAVDGDWSCEKLLLADPDGARLYAPSVIDIAANGDLILAASKL